MAKGNSHKPAYALGAIVIIAVVLIGTGVIDPQTLNIGSSSSGGGGQQTPPSTTPSTGSDFAGQLTITIVHRDALDNSETRIEGTNIVSTYYKSFDEVTYNTIGSGSGNTHTIDTAMNSMLYVATSVPSAQAFFIAPSATADRNLNPRIIDFTFKDVTADGQKEWVFKVDLHDMPPPVAGQVASSITLYINSYDDGATTLNSPADTRSVGETAGQLTWVRWEQTVGAETADPVYEYEIRMNTTTTSLWDRGTTVLQIPNIGSVSLSDFAESQDGTNTFYKYTLGSTLKDANYVTTPQNGNTIHPIPLKVSTNFSTDDGLQIRLTIRSMTSSQGTASVNDIAGVMEN